MFGDPYDRMYMQPGPEEKGESLTSGNHAL